MDWGETPEEKNGWSSPKGNFDEAFRRNQGLGREMIPEIPWKWTTLDRKMEAEGVGLEEPVVAS